MMMTVDELAVILLELAQTADREAWIAQWRPELAESLGTVILWAIGRIPAGIARRLPGGYGPDELSGAALYLVGQTCFAEDASYYELFGLRPDSVSPDVLRARYRALIRLTHPDMGVVGLPAGAASLVNRAYEVLGDEGARKAYDEQLAAAAAVSPPRPGRSAPDLHVARPDQMGSRQAEGRRFVGRGTRMGDRMLARWALMNSRWARQLRVILVGLVVMVPLGVFVFWNLSETWERDTLVALAPKTEAIVPEEAGVAALGHGKTGGAQGTGSETRLRVLPMARTGLEEKAGGTNDFPATVTREDAVDVSGVLVGRAKIDARDAGTQVASAEDLPIQDRPSRWAPDALTGAEEGQKVDWPAARRYLQDIAAAVGDASEAQWLNHYLEQTDVQGSLLYPIMALYERYGGLSARYSSWSMVEGHGLFDAETTLTVQIPSDEAGQAMRLFLLRAQFQASERGTRLKTLDLVPLE